MSLNLYADNIKHLLHCLSLDSHDITYCLVRDIYFWPLPIFQQFDWTLSIR